jgi:DNA invertase Pin-like site-specific DNA recombinase
MLVGEFIEDEGPHQRRKPHLEAAIKSAKRHDASFVIPRFRSIQRSAAIMQQLRDADIEFLALDMPGANRATIATFAAGAAQHHQRLSERIKTSFQAAKAHGRRPGNPKIALARLKAVQAASDLAQEKRQALRFEMME